VIDENKELLKEIDILIKKYNKSISLNHNLHFAVDLLNKHIKNERKSYEGKSEILEEEL
jgi:hypothetical protein